MLSNSNWSGKKTDLNGFVKLIYVLINTFNMDSATNMPYSFTTIWQLTDKADISNLLTNLSKWKYLIHYQSLIYQI